MLGDLNGRAISLEEVRKALNEMKSGKTQGLDRFSVEYLKKGGMAVLEWLVRMPLYKGNGDKCECGDS